MSNVKYETFYDHSYSIGWHSNSLRNNVTIVVFIPEYLNRFGSGFILISIVWTVKNDLDADLDLIWIKRPS